MTSRGSRPLGLWMLTALVVGNMIGSGVFLLPAALAPFGGASLLGWLVTAAGSMTIGLVFARLARRMPAAGGPYAYTREAFGELAGFLVGWGYWISCWSAVAAIAVAMVGYLGELVPGLATRPLPSRCRPSPTACWDGGCGPRHRLLGLPGAVGRYPGLRPCALAGRGDRRSAGRSASASLQPLRPPPGENKPHPGAAAEARAAA